MSLNNYDYAGLEDYIDKEEYEKYKKELEERYNKNKKEIDRIFNNIIKKNYN